MRLLRIGGFEASAGGSSVPRSVAAVAFVAALLGLLIVPGAASAADKARTKLVCCAFFDGHEKPSASAHRGQVTSCHGGLSGRRCFFIGKISSPKRRCMGPDPADPDPPRGRVVTLYLKRAGRPDRELGSETTSWGFTPSYGTGYGYSIGTRNPQYGTYYTTTRATKRCEGDRSGPFRLNENTPIEREHAYSFDLSSTRR
jgi:hypothetical protein